ncbi:CLUMA_CG011084, isoform A [Clunio marinus]|uniref:CLUMA_CG011084, isoform A n=1 Tax=Clunio marinus TaxID=568069 RepID=A0A1J1IBU7_9DIPT|nr:CLUMA_CG011084, isoform A [Clunio marinus]
MSFQHLKVLLLHSTFAVFMKLFIQKTFYCISFVAREISGIVKLNENVPSSFHLSQVLCLSFSSSKAVRMSSKASELLRI